MKTYTLPLQQAAKGTLYITLPFNAREEYGKPKGTLYVKGEINGVPYRSRLISLDQGQQAVFINKALQKQMGLEGPNATVQVTIAPEYAQMAEYTQPPVTQTSGLDTLAAITTRASARHYTQQQIDPQTITTLLNAGFCAPSATNKRPWHFVW